MQIYMNRNTKVSCNNLLYKFQAGETSNFDEIRSSSLKLGDAEKD